MAFCNSCGATLDAGAKFCSKCGTTQPAAPGAAATPATPAAAAPGKGGSSALKIILIIVAVIVGIGIIGASVIGYGIYRVAKGTHVEERNGKVRVETPFGKVESSTDPDAAAREIGVAMYPGAQMSKNGSASMTIGGIHTTTAMLETDDAPNVVADFYRSRMPNAHYSSNQGDNYSMMTGDKDDMTTVNIQGYEGRTRIQISRVTKGN